MNSLKARAGLATAAMVAVFAALTALGLDQAFREAARAAWRERLDAQLFLLMGATEVTDRGTVKLPDSLPEARLEAPDSGLYARILGAGGATLWRSPSVLDLDLPRPQAGEDLRTVAVGGTPHLARSLRVDWEGTGGQPVPLTFQVVENRSAFAAQLSRFRRTLWTYLAVAAAMLMALQAAVLRWGLRPLRGLARELQAIDRGEQNAIHGRYPRELDRLTAALNALLHHERAQQSRYRDALADLAHSLKTPLAVLRGTVPDRGEAAEQLARMDRIIGYQLQRATTSGRTTLVAPVSLAPLLKRLIEGLAKVYADKAPAVELDVDPAAAFRGSEDDLMELLGNLLDNACKWCRTQVRVRVEAGEPMIRITVEDDGPGIPEADVPVIIQRGGRLDEAVPGQGIGLAVVWDIIEAYGGELSLERAGLGGLRVELRLPGLEKS